ncbi:MAG: hypothetical protein CVV64_05025 [Candidatus Wallbacteria bacterium HGW-Wallbacteria-1]|jgi:uncharacterized protein involved in exopolysaccharide biosynthesis|uniref:Uncharacterized protein n=1 Tax=Candidatus Wallbacteria bacterium HGW-Wallbacteria-1 TaxID=2013854 RepID=A0A2N1PS20_9BACT|nr:MAG: hypothetical protein CVV64_05025 [Candidatus Wallbacteria bacterium HGW-Wallbacteria-1]
MIMIPHLDLILAAIILFLVFMLIFRVIKKVIVTAITICVLCAALYWFSTTAVYKEKVAPLLNAQKTETTKKASLNP